MVGDRSGNEIQVDSRPGPWTCTATTDEPSRSQHCASRPSPVAARHRWRRLLNQRSLYPQSGTATIRRSRDAGAEELPGHPVATNLRCEGDSRAAS